MKSIQKKSGFYDDIIYYKAEANDLCLLEEPSAHDFFALIFFEKGNGVHIIEDIKYPIRKFQVHILYPNQKHYWQFDQTTLVHQIFISRKTFRNLKTFIKYPSAVYNINPVINLTPNLFFKIIQDCMDIGYFLYRPCEINKYLILSKVKIIIQYITQEIDLRFYESNIYKKHPLLLNFLILLRNKVKDERKVSYYAEKIGITANYLNILCKKKINRTAKAFINECLVKEVEIDLTYSNQDFQSLADEYGFESLKSFKHFLKKNKLE
ncbi:AraC family transcriptional regulator [Empedobacter brevis]|uniref:AraC family transcriptional regulator n=1 Tax=Empedobacter brevis TaxID=247 RepID=UPI00289FC628|nr:hypothetical protein [Empedobacter brevis]